MLGKLFKYEFPAMGRKLGPLFIAWAAASAILGLSISNIVGDGGEGFFGITAALIYAMVTIAVFVMFIILIIQKFRNSLLGDEAYFNLTLPVSTTQHIANKTLSALTWTVLTIAAGFVSGVIIVLFSGGIKALFGPELPEFFKELFQIDIKGILIIVEFLIAAVLSIVKSVLAIYAAITIGHQARERTTLASIAAYIGLMIAESSIGNLGITLGLRTDFSLSDYAESQLVLLVAIIVTLALSAAYFFICKYLMEKKLNLN